MAIITKPVGGIFKGVPATITLNKSELSALASVSADSYFSVTTNWNKVILSYKSFDGNQQEIVEFNATLSSPTGFFDVSLTARNFFEIQVIKIIDFDGGIFIVPRSELVIADFDVIFVSPPSSLSYTTPVVYTQNETITNNVPSVIGTVNSYSISPALPTGLTINPTTGVISGTPTVAVAAANYTVTASNSGGPTTAIVNITVESAEVPVGDPIIWDLFLNGATTEADGGLIGASTAAYSFTKSNASKIDNGADFKITYKFTDLVADWVHGISSVLTEESQSQFNFTGLTYQQSFLISYYRGVQQPNQSLSILNSPGENTLIIEKTGTNLTFTLNNTVVLSKTDYTEQLTVPAVRPWNVRALDSATVELLNENYFLYDSLGAGYTTDQFGGLQVTNTSPTSFATTSTAILTGDFDIQFNFDSAITNNDCFFGVKPDLTNNDNGVGFRFYSGTLHTYFSASQRDIVSNNAGNNSYRIKRTSGLIEFYANGVKTSQSTNRSENMYLIVRAFNGFVLKSTVNLLEVPVTGDYITYNLDGYSTPTTKTSTGGVSGGVYVINNDVAVKSSTYSSTGDFDYQWKFNWSSATSINDMFVGVTGNDILNGTSFYPNLTCIYGSSNNPDTAYLWHNQSPGAVSNLTILSGENTYRLRRVGTTITHYLNGSQVYSASSTSFTAYPTVRTMGNEVCSETLLLNAPAVTWNVAGKTGVGTVTTGANGLITKTTGGSSYNVNVLSNEIITGNGYVEFINSSIFTNVVFGLAEVNSVSGSFDNIIIGGYFTGAQGLEKVYNDGVTFSYSGGVGSIVAGDIIRFERVGTTYSIKINGTQVYSISNSSQNPLKASVTIYGETFGVNNVTIAS